MMEVSRERVRQVELKALRKLRNLTRRLRVAFDERFLRSGVAEA